MLKYGNRDFRSLQEQVYANMRNIEDIIKGQDIMADYTLQIVGQVDTAAELPDADTYEGKLGDIYVVGTESPFDGYAFVKVYENENVPSWVDLGPILVQGPQGEQGPQGIQGIQGPQGDQGVPAGFGVPTASIQGTTGTPNVSITASGPNTARVFDFTFYNLKGETGAQGPAGQDGRDGVGVPEIEAGDAGKALIVNAGETAAEWTELPSGLPDIEAGDAGKALIVNSAENGVEWGIVSGGSDILVIEAPFNGASAGSIDAQVGTEVITKMINDEYDSIILKAKTSSTSATVPTYQYCLLGFTGNQNNSKWEGLLLGSATITVSNAPGIASANQTISYLIAPKSGTTDTLTITRSTNTAVQSSSVWNITLNLSGGTLTAGDKAALQNCKFQSALMLDVGNNARVKLYNTTYDSTNVYYKNIKDSTYTTQYEVVLNLSTRAYTVTQIQ